MKPLVEHGFVIVKPNGSVWDEYLYPSLEAAEAIATVAQPEVKVFPARRIWSVRQVNSLETRGWTDLIIDKGEE